MAIRIGTWQYENYKKPASNLNQGNHKVVNEGPKEWKDPDMVIQERVMADMMKVIKRAC